MSIIYWWIIREQRVEICCLKFANLFKFQVALSFDALLHSTKPLMATTIINCLGSHIAFTPNSYPSILVGVEICDLKVVVQFVIHPISD